MLLTDADASDTKNGQHII